MCILRLRSIVMAKNKRLQVQSHVVFIMNEHFNNYNPWWPREDIVFCPSCPCCFADHPRIHTDFLLIPRCDNPWKDADFAFSLWAVLYVIMTPLYWLIDSLFPSYTWRLHKYINIFTHKQYYTNTSTYLHINNITNRKKKKVSLMRTWEIFMLCTLSFYIVNENLGDLNALLLPYEYSHIILAIWLGYFWRSCCLNWLFEDCCTHANLIINCTISPTF